MPLSTISCKDPNAIKKYKDIPEDLPVSERVKIALKNGI